MAKNLRQTCAYREVRLHLDPPYTGLVVELTLPQTSITPFTKTTSGRRTVQSDTQISRDESSFAKHHLASDGSIYFRRDGRYPRNLLWRLLDDRTTLEIRSVDLTQDTEVNHEAILLLSIKFSTAIRPFSLSFAEPDDIDAVNVFAITTGNELYTLTIPKDFFINLKATDSTRFEWCKIYAPSLLKLQTPYRMFATSAYDLFVSLGDGGILKLTRHPGSDGSSWQESSFTERHWTSSFARSIKWKSHNTVRFGNVDLDPTTTASLCISPDEEHILTVCLNHTLRAWNLSTGKIAFEVDLLGHDEQSTRGQARPLIGPTQRQLLQLVQMPGRNEYYAVTYLPNQHRFKFWAIMDADDGLDGIREMRAEFSFTPQLDDYMDSSVWSLEEFSLLPSRGKNLTQLWIRARAGPVSRVFTVRLDPFDFDHLNHVVSHRELRKLWNSWETVDHGLQSVEALNALAPSDWQEKVNELDQCDVNESWLQFLFYPGRFTAPTLETALHVYLQGLPAAAATEFSRHSRLPLTERVREAVMGSLPSRLSGYGSFGLSHSSTYEQEADHTAQWQVFYGLVRDLHKRRADALSFVIDPVDQLGWIVAADCVAPIRSLGTLEGIDARHPQPKVTEAVDDVKALVGVAKTFYSFLPPSYQKSFEETLSVEIMEQPLVSPKDRIQALQERCGISGQISDDDYTKFEAAIEDAGGYGVLDAETFLECISYTREDFTNNKDRAEAPNMFGVKTVVRVAEELIVVNTSVLLGLMALLLFVEGEYDPTDLQSSMDASLWASDGVRCHFDAPAAFTKIIDMLREQEVLRFLVSNTRTQYPKSSRGGDTLSHSTSEDPTRQPYTATLLESMFIGDWTNIRVSNDYPTPTVLLHWGSQWLYGAGIIDHFDDFTSHVLADLLKAGNLSLARAFLPAAPPTPWNTYLRGRLHLALAEFDTAARFFARASMTLCSYSARFAPPPVSYYADMPALNSLADATRIPPDSARLFADTNTSQLFGAGIPAYYAHVVDLFASACAHSFVVTFAQRGLQASSSPVAKSEDSARVPTFLASLFDAAMATARFDEAYSALTRLPRSDVPAALESFVATLVSRGMTERLLGFAWTGLYSQVDSVLASLAARRGDQYWKAVYAWRVRRGDYRGAAQAAYERLGESIPIYIRRSGIQGYIYKSNFTSGGLLTVHAYGGSKAANPLRGKDFRGMEWPDMRAGSSARTGCDPLRRKRGEMLPSLGADVNMVSVVEMDEAEAEDRL
ncbi:hypothetical protein EJ06DRAFT_521300 [Trichodelitschia bisporula]|uniref:Uncharacterized protein n=1 Tax=Trichodelitschia bisporula TaxID=703511 RepID=A0A6G1I039_9PEZI|nr:hypothetical protein EJ06DRAFT_521300 [Trichodelitschia bisporula]